MKEYRVIDVKKEKTNENVEKIMNSMAKEGWEVINIQQDPLSKWNTQLIITFSREVEKIIE